MKTKLLLLLLAWGVVAQDMQMELTPMAGILVNGTLGDDLIEVDNGGLYGAIVGVNINSESFAELSYTWHKSPVRGYFYNSANDSTPVNTKVQQHNWQLGVSKDLKSTKTVTIFTVGTLGATLFMDDTNHDNAELLFSFTVGLGAKIMFSDKVGLRIDPRFQMPIISADGGAAFTGNGGVAYASVNQVLPQFALTGGLIFKI